MLDGISGKPHCGPIPNSADIRLMFNTSGTTAILTNVVRLVECPFDVIPLLVSGATPPAFLSVMPFDQ
eukprot:12937257-Prorocentrum_lima.AAC.1